MKANSATHRNIKIVLLMAFCIVSLVGYSQKGTGENSGISRQQINPELLKMEGTIEEIESAPCKYTTGKSVSGTHLTLKTQKKLVNIHLGPTSEVSNLVSVDEGDFIKMIVFKTDKLPKDQFIATKLFINGESIVLRGENFKPVWAGKKRKGKRRGSN